MSYQRHLNQEFQELQKTYTQLTARIEALQKDHDREIDSERKYLLRLRLDEASTERESILDQISVFGQTRQISHSYDSVPEKSVLDVQGLEDDHLDHSNPLSAIELNFPNAVTHIEDFYGRIAELDLISGALERRANRPVVILGERRIGKTSLQNTVIEKLVSVPEPRLSMPLRLPFGGAIGSWNDYATEVLQTICLYLGKDLREIVPIQSEREIPQWSVTEFVDLLSHLVAGIRDKTIVLCMDEFDAILVNCPKPDALRILGMTEHVIQPGNLPINMFLTMARLPEDLDRTYHSPGISKSEVVVLNPFPFEEMDQLVTGLLKNMALFSESAKRLLFRLSGGHPYFVKLMLYHLLRQNRSKLPVLHISEEIIEQIVPNALGDLRLSHVLENIYGVHFNDEERSIMIMIAGTHDGITGPQMEMLGKRSIRAAQSLVRRGYLTSENSGAYLFRVDLMRNWFRNWPLYEIESERLGLTGI